MRKLRAALVAKAAKRKVHRKIILKTMEQNRARETKTRTVVKRMVMTK
ncbi:unnamed protein product [Anisakis simplex]|uniref:Uncharacterized protein n=1 Tax=Anisakis simplex TaxID=6269 RepID=A0A0M3KGD6_ANISI|nr:unnamed protein product [Anisakis simplex]